MRHVLCEGVAGISAMGGCWEGVGGVCSEGGSYRGMWVVVPVQLGQGEEMLLFHSSSWALCACWSSVYTHLILHMFKAETTNPSNPKPYHCQAHYGMRTTWDVAATWEWVWVCVPRVLGLQMLEKLFRGNAFTAREQQGKGRWGEGCSMLRPPAAAGAWGGFAGLSLPDALPPCQRWPTHLCSHGWYWNRAIWADALSLPTHISFSLWPPLEPRACRQEQQIIEVIQLLLQNQALPWLRCPGSFCCLGHGYSFCEWWKAKWISKCPSA